MRLESEICNLQGQIAGYQAKIKELEETGVCIITSSQLNWLIEGLEFDRLDISNPIPNRVII